MRRLTTTVLLTMSLLGLGLTNAPAANAAGEYWKVLGVDVAGCADNSTNLDYESGGLVFGDYVVHTVVSSGGLVYMNEAVEGFGENETGVWGLYEDFTYGPVPNAGTWPIPAGQPVYVDILLERPAGTVLHHWRTVIGNCATGNVLYNDLASLDADRDLVKTPTDLCPGAAQPGAANGCPQVRRRATLTYKVRTLEFAGRVVSAVAPLAAGESVTLYRVRKGADKRVGRATTAADGTWRLRFTPRSGKYYAVVAAVTDPAAGQAGDAVSRKVRLRLV